MTRSLLFFALVACTATAEDKAPVDSGEADSDTDADGDTDSDADTDTDSGDTDSGNTDTGDDPSDSADDGGDSGEADSGDDSGAPPDPETGDTEDPDPETGETDVPDSGTEDSAEVDSGGGSVCAVSDLILTAEARDSNDVVGTSFPPTEDLTMVAVLSNPCSADISFDTTTTCLFTGASVADSSGNGIGVAVACAGVRTSWTIPAGTSLEEGYFWGRLRVDTYSLSVTADVARGMSATSAFEVK